MSRMGEYATEQIEAPSMEPQPWCCLPWCGRAPGGPNKVRVVGGKRLEYPEGIDAHHPFGRPGPVVYVCHECHIKHHDGRKRLGIDYDQEDSEWYVAYADGNGFRVRPLVIADPEEAA